jgi:hypothetical protein
MSAYNTLLPSNWDAFKKTMLDQCRALAKEVTPLAVAITWAFIKFAASVSASIVFFAVSMAVKCIPVCLSTVVAVVTAVACVAFDTCTVCFRQAMHIAVQTIEEAVHDINVDRNSDDHWHRSFKLAYRATRLQARQTMRQLCRHLHVPPRIW